MPLENWGYQLFQYALYKFLILYSYKFQAVLPNIKVHAYFAPVTPPVIGVAGTLIFVFLLLTSMCI